MATRHFPCNSRGVGSEAVADTLLQALRSWWPMFIRPLQLSRITRISERSLPTRKSHASSSVPERDDTEAATRLSTSRRFSCQVTARAEQPPAVPATTSEARVFPTFIKRGMIDLSQARPNKAYLFLVRQRLHRWQLIIEHRQPHHRTEPVIRVRTSDLQIPQRTILDYSDTSSAPPNKQQNITEPGWVDFICNDEEAFSREITHEGREGTGIYDIHRHSSSSWWKQGHPV